MLFELTNIEGKADKLFSVIQAITNYSCFPKTLLDSEGPLYQE